MKFYPFQSISSIISQDIQITAPGWMCDFIAEYQPDSQLGKRLDGTELAFDTAEACMEFAIQLSAKNVAEKSGGPFGTGLFAHDTGRGIYTLLAPGVNRVVPCFASRGHGENMALEAASRRYQVARLSQIPQAKAGQKILLFTNGETCAQCLEHACACEVDGIFCAANGDDIEKLTGFWEGVKPPDWHQLLESRGINSGSLLRERALPVLEEYARTGLIYNASAAPESPGESTPASISSDLQNKVFPSESAIRLPEWVDVYLEDWKVLPRYLRRMKPRLLTDTEIQDVFNCEQGRMAFVNELADEAVQRGLPPVAAALFVKTKGGYELLSVGVQLTHNQHSASLTASVVAVSLAQRAFGTFAVPSELESILTTNVISGYDLGALCWAGPARVEYGLAAGALPAEHSIRAVLPAGLSSPVPFAEALAKLAEDHSFHGRQTLPTFVKVS